MDDQEGGTKIRRNVQQIPQQPPPNLMQQQNVMQQQIPQQPQNIPPHVQQQIMQQQMIQQQIAQKPQPVLPQQKKNRFGVQIENKNIKNSVIVIIIFIILNSKIIWRALSKMPMMGTLEPSIVALIVNSVLAGIVFFIISSKFNKV